MHPTRHSSLSILQWIVMIDHQIIFSRTLSLKSTFRIFRSLPIFDFNQPNPLYLKYFSYNVLLIFDVCYPLCGPDRGLHHLTNPMQTLFPPYPNRIALDIYQFLAAPFTRSTTTPPQLTHINSRASELCPPPSTGALTRL